MSVIEDGETYYIQYAGGQRYVSMPKKPDPRMTCVAVPKDEVKYYQRWQVKVEPAPNAFEMSCVFTEATEQKFTLGIQTINEASGLLHQPIIADKVEDGRSWIVQDTAAKTQAAKKKAAKKAAAKTKDTDKEETVDKEATIDKEDTSDREGASDKDEAAKVTTYAILKRQLNASAGDCFDWSVVSDSNISLLCGASGRQTWTFVKVDEDAAAA